MAEYIERSVVVRRVMETKWERGSDGATAMEIVASAPAADVAPVVHGRWELLRKGDWDSVFVCSVCGRRETIAESESYNSQLKMPRKYPYCHCGAKMDGGGSDAAD